MSCFSSLYSKLFGQSASRSARLKQNVAVSLLVKVGSIVCSLVMVPVAIDFVNDVQYGIWLTISSIVAWMSFFDIGFTNGLRNKLAEAFAFKDNALAKVYVSTTYFILSVIFFFLALLLLLLVQLLDISSLLNISGSYETELKVSLSVLIVYFCITFVLRILSVVLIADQRPAYSSFIDFVGQLLSLAAILIFRNYVDGSLTILSYCLCIPPLLVWVFFTFYCYSGKRYRCCSPSVKHIRMEYSSRLLALGLKFFVIQIAALIQFQTANILIARLYSMGEVTQYNIAYKYFNVLYMFFMILLQPFWSAVTDAYAKGDYDWIKSMVRKYLKVVALIAVGGLLMLVLSDFVYKVWIGGAVQIPFSLSTWMMVYFVTTIFGAVFVYFVNGIGALRIQYYSSLVSPLLFFALVMLMCKWGGMGMYAILIASVVANFNGLLLAPMQYYKILIKRREGIWSM